MPVRWRHRAVGLGTGVLAYLFGGITTWSATPHATHDVSLSQFQAATWGYAAAHGVAVPHWHYTDGSDFATPGVGTEPPGLFEALGLPPALRLVAMLLPAAAGIFTILLSTGEGWRISSLWRSAITDIEGPLVGYVSVGTVTMAIAGFPGDTIEFALLITGIASTAGLATGVGTEWPVSGPVTVGLVGGIGFLVAVEGHAALAMLWPFARTTGLSLASVAVLCAVARVFWSKRFRKESADPGSG